jgi:hypothetical protein
MYITLCALLAIDVRVVAAVLGSLPGGCGNSCQLYLQMELGFVKQQQQQRVSLTVYLIPPPHACCMLQVRKLLCAGMSVCAWACVCM